MIFSRDSKSHNRTDIHDRNLNNIYGDARVPSSRQRTNEEEKNQRTTTNQQNFYNSMPNQRTNNQNFRMPPRNPFAAPPPQNPYEFANVGMRAPPSRSGENMPGARTTPYQNTSSNPYENFSQAARESRGEPRRRGASPAIIFQTYFTTPGDPTAPARAFSFARVIRDVSPDANSNEDIFSRLGIFNSLFRALVGDIFDQEMFVMNFNTNFRSNDVFQDIINQSAAAAQEAAKKPTAKSARSKLATVKITKAHCKKGKDGKYEEPSCTICICEIPKNDMGIVLPCGHIFHPD